MSNIAPINLNRAQISHLAELFAEKTQYIPCETDIFDYVKTKLNGEIRYSDAHSDSVGGFIEVKNKEDFTIYLSQITSKLRDVFTIAHELGHYVLHSKIGQIPITANRSNDIDNAEREANTFAASFLMPEKLVREYAKDCKSISELAKKFKVSLTTMTWRCRNLNINVR